MITTLHDCNYFSLNLMYLTSLCAWDIEATEFRFKPHWWNSSQHHTCAMQIAIQTVIQFRDNDTYNYCACIRLKWNTFIPNNSLVKGRQRLPVARKIINDGIYYSGFIVRICVEEMASWRCRPSFEISHIWNKFSEMMYYLELLNLSSGLWLSPMSFVRWLRIIIVIWAAMRLK